MPPYTQSPDNERLFTRPMGPNEQCLNLIADLTPSPNRKGWYINSFATIKPRGSLTFNSLPDTFRKAWANLRFRQPSIAAYMTADAKHLAYQVPSADDLEEWLEESFIVDRESADAQEVIRSPRNPKYWTCTFIEKSQELVCYTAHWRSDGIGVIQLFDALFSLTTDAELRDPKDLPWGEEVSRLTLSIEDAAGVPEHANDQQKEVAQKYLATWGLTTRAVGIPCIEHTDSEREVMPGGTLIARTTFSEEITAKVVSRCKEMGISVTSAVHSSIASTNWTFADADRKHQHYTSTARFSFKPYLSAPYNSPVYAAALLTTGWMVSVDPHQSWEERARYYNSVYRAGLSKEFIDAYRVFAQSICDVVAHAPKAVGPAAEVDISSIGVLERHVRGEYGNANWGLEVLDVGAGVETVGRSCGLFVWTFRNRLVLSLVFNEEFHEVRQMGAFNEAVKEDLLRELSIQG